MTLYIKINIAMTLTRGCSFESKPGKSICSLQESILNSEKSCWDGTVCYIDFT